MTMNQSGGGKGPISKIVLQGIPVLAAGTQMEVKEGESVPVKVVTLEVTPKQAEKLAMAATKGKIRLALRRAGDNKTAVTKGITTADLISRTGPGLPPKISVQVIRGSAVSTKSF